MPFWLRCPLVAGPTSLVLATLLSQANGQPPAALVVVGPVVQRDVTAGQVFVGTIEPSQRVVIGSAVDGRVVERLCEAGDRVESGSAIARLLTSTIELEREAALAEQEVRREQLVELENGTRPLEIEQARARLAAAESRRTYLAAKLERTRAAFDSGRAASRDEFEGAESAAQESQQDYLAAKAAWELANEGPRVEQIAQARAQLASQDAIVERLTDQIAKHTIISRFTGYVVAEFTECGAWVKRGDPVAEVAALDEVEVVVHVVEQYVPYIKLHAKVRVEVPALSSPGGGRSSDPLAPAEEKTIAPERITSEWEGEVLAVVPQADLKARTFPVKVRVVNRIGKDGPALKAGMLARVTLPIGALQQAALVPKDALVLGGPTPLVYVIAEQNGTTTVVPRPVTLGVADGPLIQATGGLQEGELVVVQGNERLRPGQEVQVVRPRDESASASSGVGN